MSSSSATPTKPPRGVKQMKETSGLLMSVIRTLSASETNEQREKEKSKLEREYKRSDEKLDQLVATHSNDITQVMQVFSNGWSALVCARTQAGAARARLAACRGLLRVRRDDLRRLWADARLHAHALDMLTQIERLVAVDAEVCEELSRGNHLSAACALANAQRLSQERLGTVPALRHLLEDLKNKRERVIIESSDALANAVYRWEKCVVVGLNRQGSVRERAQSNALASVIAELTKGDGFNDVHLQEITPELEASLTDDEKTFDLTCTILMEALLVLDAVEDATERFKVGIQGELLQLIEEMSKRVCDGTTLWHLNEGEGEGEGDGESAPLVHLLWGVRKTLKLVGSRQADLLNLWRRAITVHYKREQSNQQQRQRSLLDHLHTEQHYWSAVQQVLQLLLTDYLDIKSVTLTAEREHAPERLAAQHNKAALQGHSDKVDINSYFLKKKQQPRRRTRLYRAPLVQGQTSGAQGPVTGAEATPANRKGKPLLVCRPTPDHLPRIYPIIEGIIADVESNVATARIGSADECSLKAFLADYVRHGEAERLANEARLHVDKAMREPSAWREAIHPTIMTSTTNAQHTHQQIFTCAANAWSGVDSAVRWGWRVGGSEGVRASLFGVDALIGHVRSAHHHLAPPPHARSQKWLADDDIVRFLRSLPNWNWRRRPVKATMPDGGGGGEAEAESESGKRDNVRVSGYEREAEILGASLGDGAITKAEICTATNTLRDVALLCETTDWLSDRIEAIPSSLVGGVNGKLPDNLTSELSAKAACFSEISDKCLLLLHLELRIQCFYYLGQEDGGVGTGAGAGGEEGDGRAGAEGGAARLAAALLAFHEEALPILKADRLNYVLEGVGEMMSAAVVWRWQGRGEGEGEGEDGARASGGGSHRSRVATLRHCLSALGLPSNGLHRATRYLQLLTMTPEEIIDGVKQRGVQFTELEYLNAFKVIGKRRLMPDNDMKAHLANLSSALGHIGVTV